ncbi:MAG: DUF2782 domain-containing protein [Nitrosomonadales bacterium]|nr:DUF2782 domain-containing protein [Nitrosomonadales bacterium]
MRLITTFFLCGLCGIALAAEPQAPDLPPPPQLDAGSPDADLEPQVTITKHTEQTVEEYRMGGRLYMIKIIPRIGKPYYLVDDLGDGKFSRQESLDSGVRPPRWVIRQF